MVEDADRLEPAPRTPRARLLRIVPVERRAGLAVTRGGSPLRGVPRTSEEWTALVKVGSGERDISRELCACLLALGLVITVSGTPALTRHGRYTLGLPE
jgi:hypothetical protein